jgi:pimeloyl-ACP methyl ester carboxylesterase
MPTKRSLLRRVLRGIAALAMLGVLALAALAAFLWLEHRSTATLPTPTGSFGVGRAILDWTDPSAMDPLAPNSETRRELLIWIWYPSASQPSAAMDDYVPAELPKTGPGSTNIWTFLTRDVSTIRGHSQRAPEVSARQRSYPVVIMRAGGSASVQNYSTLTEDLASHGYVVVGFDAPYRTGRVVFPDGRIVDRAPQNNPEVCVVSDAAEMERCVSRFMTAWTGDIAFVLDRLTALNASDPSGRFVGRLDMTRVGIFGHSLGGAVAAQFCGGDSRCKAGIDIDGAPHGSVIRDGLAQPFMFLLSDHRREADPDSVHIKQDIQSIYGRIPPDRRLLVTIRGAFHFMFSDDGAVMKSSVVRGVLRVLGKLDIAAGRQVAVATYCVHTFFDHYLKGTGDSRLNISSPLYPEIQPDE